MFGLENCYQQSDILKVLMLLMYLRDIRFMFILFIIFLSYLNVLARSAVTKGALVWHPVSSNTMHFYEIEFRYF